MLERVQDAMVRQAVPITPDAFQSMLRAILKRFPFPQLADVFDVVNAMRMHGFSHTDATLLHLISALCLAFQTRQAGHLAWQALAPGSASAKDPELLAAISRTFGHLGMNARCVALIGLMDAKEQKARALMANHLLKAMLIKLVRFTAFRIEICR